MALRTNHPLSRRCASALLLCALVALVAPPPAAAYIDPGTGSIVLQLLIAGALGAAFAVKRFWKRIVESVRAVFKRS